MAGKSSGFSLVELMVVVAIMAILAGIGIPAYINYQNRAKQTEAVEALLRAKMDQEAFWAENARYAATIGCLYSFGNNCSRTSYLTSSSTAKSYIVSVAGTTIQAQRVIPSTGQTDTLTISSSGRYPTVVNPGALKFSVFQWLFY